MNYGIIGAGNVGLTFAYYLYKSKKNFLLLTRDISEKKEFFKYVPKRYFTEDFNKFNNFSNTIFVATPDRLIRPTVKSITQKGTSKIIFIFSGSYSSKTRNVINLHPAASIPKPVFRKNFIREILFTTKDSSEVKALIKDLNIKVVYLKSFSPLYHVGAMFASNFITILLFAAENIIKPFVKDREDTKSLLNSFAKTGLDAYFSQHKLSGPVARGDISTIDKHKQALKGKKEISIYNSLIKYGVHLFNGKK